MALLGLGACGDNEMSCPLVLYPMGHTYSVPATHTPDNCVAAMLFASRDTPTLTPSQSEIDLYFDRWSRAVVAEPILRNRVPQRHRSDTGVEFGFETTNTTVIAALRGNTTADGAVPTTGDQSFDSIMSELVTPQLSGKGTDNGMGGASRFTVLLGATFNEELLATRLLTTSSKLPDPLLHYRDDGAWLWNGLGPGPGTDDVTAEIDFSFGWGDCFVQCDGMHQVRAIVPPTGVATVYDLGGDRLPAGLALSPNTRPL